MSKPTDRELEAMGRQQRELALELAQFEEDTLAKAGEPADAPGIIVPTPAEPQPAQPEPEIVSVAEDETAPVPEPAPEPELAPEPMPESPKVEEIRDVDYWRREAERERKESETWKKRKGDADRALSPAQQEAARLRKEKEEHEATFSRRLDEIESLVKQVAKPTPLAEPVSPQIVDDEFKEIYPDIALKLEAIQKANEDRVARAEAKTREFETFFENQRQEAETARQNDYRAKHYVEVKRLLPDVDEFIAPEKLGTPLLEWAKTQPPYKQEVILCPLAHQPADVVDVINQFKTATGMNAPKSVKKPNLGDLATRAQGAPPNIAEPKGGDFLTDEEYEKIEDLMRKAAKDPREVNRLLTRYERTTEHKLQHD